MNKAWNPCESSPRTTARVLLSSSLKRAISARTVDQNGAGFVRCSTEVKLVAVERFMVSQGVWNTPLIDAPRVPYYLHQLLICLRSNGPAHFVKASGSRLQVRMSH